MNVLGLLTGMVQAYIFSILATVYITAAVHNSKKTEKPELVTNNKTNNNG
jgi:F-type H+-transporting ATPase subunit a